MTPPTVAIIGAGLMGAWHARYARQAGARVVAVVDRDLARARALAAPYAAKAFHSDQPWWTAGPEIVHICTPSHTHPAIIEPALDQGCHVLVEKPLASDLATTRHLLDRAVRANRRLLAVHQMPYQRGLRRLRARLPSLGTLRSIVYRTFTAGGDGRDRAGRQALLREILPHPVSLLHALGYTNVEAEHWRVDAARDDALTLTASHQATALRIEIDLAARPTCNELRVAGTSGSALADLFHGFATIDRAPVSRRTKLLRPWRITARTMAAASINLALRAARRQGAYPGLAELIAATHHSLSTTAEPPVQAREILAAAALAERVAAQQRINP